MGCAVVEAGTREANDVFGFGTLRHEADECVQQCAVRCDASRKIPASRLSFRSTPSVVKSCSSCSSCYSRHRRFQLRVTLLVYITCTASISLR